MKLLCLSLQTGIQQKALTEFMMATVAHITDLSSLLPRVQEIVHRHVAIGVLPAHFTKFHECFMGALVSKVPQEDLTEEVVKAWSDFILFLAGCVARSPFSPCTFWSMPLSAHMH
jgi:nitric oxide dioxygenase